MNKKLLDIQDNLLKVQTDLLILSSLGSNLINDEIYRQLQKQSGIISEQISAITNLIVTN